MNQSLRSVTAFLTLLLLALTCIGVGCKSNKTTSTQETAPAPAQSAAPNAAPSQAATMSIDDLVAPIALYPDQLLAQVLSVAANPQEVLDVGNWLLQNQNLQGDALTNAAKQAGFSPSAQYLVLFPQVVDNMCQEMDWTTQLGEAFKTDQKAVMDAVQRKRVQAQQMGNLSSSPQMTVDTKQADNGQKYVEIQPADPKVVYVPQYNPVTIYNTPAPAAPVVVAPATTTATTTTTETKSGVSTGTAVAIGLLSFGVGMAVGSAISNNNNYYPYPSWGYHSVYVVGRPYYPPVYRPPVYPGYRPAYGYHPPANYHWNQYNRNVNVNVNNNYYNRFNNTNVNRNNNVSTLPANRPGQTPGNNWKGQSTYQGAHPSTLQGERPGASMANVNPATRPGNQGAGTNRFNGNNAGANNLAANRPNNLGAGNTAANRPNNLGAGNNAANRPNAGAGAGNMNRSPGGSTMARPTTQPNLNRGGDRGYGTASPAARPTTSAASRPQASPASRPAPSNYNRPAGNSGGGAFGGAAGNNARADRAASSRGRSSMGASGGGGKARSSGGRHH